MNKNIYIYPRNGQIVKDKECTIWVKFTEKNEIEIESLKMKINKKIVPALLSNNGIIYNQRYALEYGTNDVQIEWKDKHGAAKEYRWRFVLLEYKIGISEKELSCIDLSFRKNEDLKIKDIMDVSGIPIFTKEQLNRKVALGKGGRKTGEVDLIELLDIKKDNIKNIDESKSYVFGEIIEKSKKHYVYEIVLGKRGQNQISQKQNEDNIKMYHFKSSRAMDKFLSKNDMDGYFLIKDKNNLNEGLKEYINILNRGLKVGIWGINAKEDGHMRVKVYGKNYISAFHEGVKNKRSIVSNIDEYKITFSINGRIIGDTVVPQFKDTLEISCSLKGNETIKEVQILGKNRREIYKKKLKGEKSIRIKEVIDITCESYALCVVKCSGNKEIITSPIWIGKN